MILDFSGKKVFITGGTGGIGSCCVENFAKQGADITFTSSNFDKIKLLIDRVGLHKAGQLINGEICDLSDLLQISETVKKTKESMGIPDIVICNAGTNADKLSSRMDMTDWTKVINVNLNANFKLAVEFLTSMVNKKIAGKVIFITSVVAHMGNMGQANYAASKAGLEGMMRCLALEYARYGITVNALAPGFIETQMTEKLPDTIKQTMLKRIPLGAYGKPDDVFNALAFLASNYANYITGQVIHVNGGMFFGC